jgi:methionyl-tRNA synthetase
VEAVERLDFASALAAIVEVGAATNKYFGDRAPWSLYKTGRDKEGAAVLRTVLEVLRRLALYLQPATPALSERVLLQLGFNGVAGVQHSEVLAAGQTVRRTGPVLPRLE